MTETFDLWSTGASLLGAALEAARRHADKHLVMTELWYDYPSMVWKVRATYAD